MWPTAPGARALRLATTWRPALTVGLAGMLLMAGPPDLGFQGALLILVFVAVGLPHGALDHVVAERVFGIPPIRLYVAYLALAAVLFAAWHLAPFLAALLFLGLSAWHFGEGDLRGLRVRPALGPWLVLSRGWLVLGALSLAHPADVAGLLGPWSPPTLVASSPWMPVLVGAPHLLLLALGLHDPPGVRLRAMVDASILLAWLWVAPPLLAFTVYFGLWHSLDHLVHLRESRLDGPRAWTWAALLGRGFPNALASALGILVLTLVGVGLGAEDALWGAALGALAAVATPHLVLVEAWRQVGTPSR